MKLRRATVSGRDLTREQLERFLPDNYIVVAEGGPIDNVRSHGLIIEGEDVAGWTLHDYVIPRLASGLIWVEEMSVE